MKPREILAFLCILISIPLIGTWYAVGLAVLGVGLFFARRPSPAPGARKDRPGKLERELRQELHYRQMIVRMDRRALQRSMEACKRIAAKLREKQRERRANLVRQPAAPGKQEPEQGK